jgi:hypothetical protein
MLARTQGTTGTTGQGPSVITPEDTTDQLVEKVFDYSISSLDHARHVLDRASVAQAIDILFACEEALFFGFGASGIIARRFDSIEAARAHCQRFFVWYNDVHRHGGLGLHTASDVHHGHAGAVRNNAPSSCRRPTPRTRSGSSASPPNRPRSPRTRGSTHQRRWKPSLSKSRESVPLSRHGARCWHYCRSVSPCLSPNPPCDSHRNGLSTVPFVRQFVGSRDWGSCCRGSGTGLPESLRCGVVRPCPP